MRDLYGRRLDRIDKGAGDFATAADVAAEKAILGVIAAARPDDASMLVAVNVALGDGAAAVADPFGGEVYCTDGESAWVRREGGEARLSPSSATRLVDVNLDPPFPSAPGFRAVDPLTHPRFVADFRPRVVSTTLALAWVAAGKRAAYVTDGTDLTGSVHFAAGIAVCRAAGCVVTGLDGAPIGPGSRGLVAAADAGTHERLMSVIGDRG
ncbi:inositol monophosphatase family protein [Streptomyces kanamyceticus]|uniref:inositol monophosphatase family protein n=1 Tax=Streptomyces kanamyceticus TaxID=1967 RepID=UPI0037DD77F5